MLYTNTALGRCSWCKWYLNTVTIHNKTPRYPLSLVGSYGFDEVPRAHRFILHSFLSFKSKDLILEHIVLSKLGSNKYAVPKLSF